MMTALGNWIKDLAPLKLAAVILLGSVTMSFSLGATSVRLTKIPNRIEALEANATLRDSVLTDLTIGLNRHIAQDSIATERIYCTVKLMAENEGPVNPLVCR